MQMKMVISFYKRVKYSKYLMNRVIGTLELCNKKNTLCVYIYIYIYICIYIYIYIYIYTHTHTHTYTHNM